MKKLCLMLTAALLLLLCACASGKQADLQPEPPDISESAVSWDGLTFDRELPLSYATQFSVSYAGDDYTRITIGTDQEFLLVAENAETPEHVPESVTVLHRPLSHIYLVASAAMDYFDHLDAVDRISLSGLKTGDWYIESAKAAMDYFDHLGAVGSIALSGLKAGDWYIESAKAAMEAGSMRYAGKYSAPDYEAILESGCDLAIENTMIYHTPEVIEQLQTTGVPVLVERSSYESSPLGRIEWLKLYGALVGKEDLACSQYDELLAALSPILDQEASGQTVAFFYINSSGAVNVRKSGDYIAKAIAMAGGQYVSFDESGEENALSTMTIQMESFYASAVDADIMIYNSTIDGEIRTIDELLTKSPLLADCKAVQAGTVWCITKNFYQESLALGDLILDVHAILQDKAAENLHFLRKLS